MNSRQLEKLGVSSDCAKSAIMAIQAATRAGACKGKELKQRIKQIVEKLQEFVEDEHFGAFAREWIAQRSFVRPDPISYRTWGSQIDHATHAQMRQACAVPVARGAALMPDAHVGYGLPIGGVLAVEGAVIPYAVGVDIACRMKLSVLDVPAESLDKCFDRYQHALEQGTRFGIGSVHETPRDHAVMDADWSITRITREHKDRAWRQLGTSGSGNHFVEFGLLTISGPVPGWDLQPGRYAALLSHSGSRGAGSAVCATYSNRARARLDKRFADLGYLAWLTLDSQEGQEYWAAMSLMGDYAAANHDVIHRLVSKLLGARIVAGVENHHNFAWKEIHQGRELIVHRKGATPAAEGELGVIPGSMASPAFIVRGKGHAESFHSASHGAGRRMSRRQAREKYNFGAVRKQLEQQGVIVLSAGADEVPYVYKDIEQVMREQSDLVEPLARFDPRIVKMCDDHSKAED